MLRKLASLFSLLACSTTFAVVPDAGPMIGHVTDNSARVWLQFPIAGEVTVNVYDAARGIPVGGVRTDLEGPSPFVCDVALNGLQPNRTYRIEVKFDGDPVKLPGPDVAIRTTPSTGEQATFTVGFGGGIAITPFAGATTREGTTVVPQAHKIPIMNAINNIKPRMFFFLGDTGNLPAKLSDYPTTHKAAYRFLADFHSAIRKEPDLQELFRTSACYATFGDRDYGPIFSDADYPFAQESLVAFHNYWPNPDWGTPANPGSFCNFSYGDVDFYLLDARTFRTTPKAGDEGHLFGDAQLAWLEKNLKLARGSFKVIAAPSILWGDDPQKPDPNSWTRYPAEQRAFLKWLADNRINGVLSIAGGQPLGQLIKFDAPGLSYPLFSLSTSALLSAPGANAEAAPNPNRVSPAIPTESFGTLDFGGQLEHRFITLHLRDASGKSRFDQTLLSNNLKN